jgi:hypothetical protein
MANVGDSGRSAQAIAPRVAQPAIGAGIRLPAEDHTAGGLSHGRAGPGDEVAEVRPSPGLVVTVQNRPRNSADGSLAEVLGLRFPGFGDVVAAANALRSASRESGRRSLIEVSPGSIRFRRTIPDDPDAEEPSKDTADREPVRVWTAKSRRQMIRSYAALDFTPLYEADRLPVSITLTYPKDWLIVAPDGEAVQGHFAAFQRRWLRAWGEPMICLWKREFQRRGAAHFHIYAAQPAGVAGDVRKARHLAELAAWEAAGKIGHPPRWRPVVGDGLRITQWVAQVWADVVNHPDPGQRADMIRAGSQVSFKEGLRYADPKRLSIYFAKHGLYRDKEYQNTPPAEWDGKPVGRFWGKTGLETLIISANVDGGRDYYVAKRTMRRWAARTRIWDQQTLSVRYVKAVRQLRVARGAQRRVVHRPVSRLAGASGSICVNDAPSIAADLARVIALTVQGEQPKRRRPVRPSTADMVFYHEHCGGSHPLREHRVCEARARGVVMLR